MFGSKGVIQSPTLAIVKDADKLCRFTPTAVNIDHTRFGIARGTDLDWIAPMIDNWLFTPEAKDMARKALSEAKSASATSGPLF